MITHVVMFRLKDRSPESIAEIAELLRAMEGKIPELRSIEVGVDELHSQRSFDIALRTEHESWEDLDAYQKHPVHQGVGARLVEVLDRSVAVDFTR